MFLWLTPFECLRRLMAKAVSKFNFVEGFAVLGFYACGV
jgi:hypothetical protein